MLKVKWPRVIEIPDHPYINMIDLGNYTAFTLVAFMTFRTRDALFIGVEDHGNYLFPCDRHIHWEYTAEKLFLRQADARNLSDFINTQIWQFQKQQGFYDEFPLTYHDPHYNPWKPEIIND